MIFSDETWAKNDLMWKKYVLIYKDDDINKYALKKRKPKGWMFWGCFTGREKAPGWIWEKRMGRINSGSYVRWIVPQIIAFRWRLLHLQVVF